ncbi:RND superfamily putative drug exporter [Kitasatospora sp. MAA4]|uniref:MMPL family transporter n=1 Tax=Kitasatospora sp. MAA4 TaxID=3035093 RepID=UPI00247549DF|nr:MMPL family transporter [Kitasatospora sp. MAA4]MDH6135754.1 RND superfamily putative drug exporter [Kitasatospora sp. MAA4]
MATLLYRLGHGAYRRRKLVLALWLAVLAALIACTAVFGGKLDDRFTVPGAESQTALDTLARTFPPAAGSSAQLVFSAPAGQDVTAGPYAAAIARSLAAAEHAPQVAAVITPQQAGTVSADRSTAVAQVQYPVQRSQVQPASLTAVEAAAHTADSSGLKVSVGGSAYGSRGVAVGATEVIGVVVALLVLVVTFGSLLAAGMPLVSALIGVGIALAGLLALTPLVQVSSTAITLALMLGLAVGIDYALFILSRHRGQLAQGLDPQESAARANGTAGSAVVFAGSTVIIALAALSVIGIPFLTVMGLGAAGAVLIAVLVAVTLLPALAGFAGTRLAPRPGSRAARRAVPQSVTEAPARDTLGARWARLATARPLLTVLAVTAVLIIAALPVAGLRLGLPDNGSAARNSTERQAYDTISARFGAGFNGPLLVLTDTANPADGRQAALQVAQSLKELPGVAAVAPPQATRAPGQAVIQLVPTTGPEDQQTADLARTIRDRAPALLADTGAKVAVTGTTAVNIDVSDRLAASLLPFVAIVVGLSLLLLTVVFRSLVVPVKATAGFLLSVAASLGLVVALFQWGWLADALGVAHTGPVVSFLPIILIGVLFGLAMDYEVFLVSGMREQWIHTGRAQESIITGTRQNARVVTAAALIMFTVFAGFFPADDAIIKPIAFSLAVGILIDAFAVRLTLVPAVLALVGPRAWWLPARLERLLPDLDVEGAHLPPVGVAAGAKEPALVD